MSGLYWPDWRQVQAPLTTRPAGSFRRWPALAKALREHGPMTPPQLAEHLNLDKKTVRACIAHNPTHFVAVGKVGRESIYQAKESSK